MSTVLFITHPEVTVEPGRSVPEWSLSARGVARMRAFVLQPLLADVASIFASTETKALEAAQILASAKGLPVHVLDALGENDRSSTGFLHKDEFEGAANVFFAQPAVSHRGWETALDAQRRIVRALEQVLQRAEAGDVAIVSHGAVGTLLKCWLKQAPITRQEDQPFQGHYYRFDRETRRLLHDWSALPVLQSE